MKMKLLILVTDMISEHNGRRLTWTAKSDTEQLSSGYAFNATGCSTRHYIKGKERLHQNHYYNKRKRGANDKQARMQAHKKKSAHSI
jgi:hypothetical protein